MPTRFLGGPGMLSRTSFASLDFFMMTSLSRIAVCMRLTSVWFLMQETLGHSEFGLQSKSFSCSAHTVCLTTKCQYLQVLPFPAAAC